MLVGCENKSCPKVKGYPKLNIKVPIIWVIGGPCSGKGTQCEKIVAKYKFTHLSTGDLLRAEVNSGSARGSELKAIMDKGELVPNDIVLALLVEAICVKLCNTKGFLIDGYPREKDQGLMFEQKIGPVTCVLYFEVSEKTMLERMLNRSKTSDRSDDNEETIKKRIETFHKETGTILTQYSSKVKKIDAERKVDAIFSDVQKAVNPLVNK